MERNRSEKYISICSDSQVALKILQAVITTYSLERQCRRALDDRSAHRSVRLIWLPKNSGVSGNTIIDERASEGSAHQFVGPEPTQEIRHSIKGKLYNQHMTMWQRVTGTQKQVRAQI